MYKYNKLEKQNNFKFLNKIHKSDKSSELIKEEFSSFYFNIENNLNRYYYENGIYKLNNENNTNRKNNIFNTLNYILNSSNYTTLLINHFINIMITISITIIVYNIYNISYGLFISIFAISLSLISLIDPNINYK